MKTNHQNKNIIIMVVALIFLFGLVSFALNLIASNQTKIQEKQNQVAEIIDGDTFRLENGDVVRLLCVDTPEKGETGYEEAVSFLGGKLLYENIKLQGNKTDRYGRLLKWVWVNNSLINKEIIKEGYGELLEYDHENCSLIK